MRRKRFACLLVAPVFWLLTEARMFGQALNDPDPCVRRKAVLALAKAGSVSVDVLSNVLTDNDVVVRRTAARELARLGKPAMPSLAQAITNEDIVVRRIAVLALAGMGQEAIPCLAKALEDEDSYIRESAVISLSMVRPGSEEILNLLAKAAKDDVPGVQTAAAVALANFFEILESIRLPAEGWAFQLDPHRKGEEESWFRPDLDERGWKHISIEKAWQDEGVEYIGVAWYRRWIDLPKRAQADKAVLHFGGVDECAWVWVNGQYAGEHDVGPKGWNQPFRLDVTGLIRWGQPNQITVRAMNTASKGGIWQPVTLEVLRVRQ